MHRVNVLDGVTLSASVVLLVCHLVGSRGDSRIFGTEGTHNQWGGGHFIRIEHR